jgi:Protein of unknown function (DUF4199)
MLNRPYIKYPIIYGFLAGVFCFCFLLFLQIGLNINPLGGKKEVGIVFVIIAMILATSAMRKANGGAIEFRAGYGICFSTTIIASIASLGFLYIFLEIISTNTLPQYIQNTTAELVKNKVQIIKNGISEDSFLEALKNIKITTLKSILIDDFIKKIFLSIIPSLMVSLYFRRRFIN